MRSPEGQDSWSTGIYQGIVELERIAMTDSFADEHGNVVSSSHYGMGDEIPLELLVTITFEDLGGKTQLTVVHTGMPAGENTEMAGHFWNDSFDKLDAIFNE